MTEITIDEELREKNLPELTSEQQRLFVKHYIATLNASQAAILSGYTKSNARYQGSKLLAKDNIRQHIHFHLERNHKKLNVSTDRVLREVAGVAFSRMTDFIERDSPEEVDRQIEALEVDDFSSITEYKREVQKIMGALRVKPLEEMGDSICAIDELEFQSNGITNIKTKGKLKALELLGKHVGIWNYEPETKGRDRNAYSERLRQAVRITRERSERRNGSEEDSGDRGGDS